MFFYKIYLAINSGGVSTIILSSLWDKYDGDGGMTMFFNQLSSGEFNSLSIIAFQP